MRKSSRAGVLALLIGAALTAPRSARAAGLYFSDRGVRPMGRAGAFVAGADDLGAIWYNPAGLTEAGTSILVDADWLHFSSGFTRRTLYDDGSGTLHLYQYAPVSGSSAFVPVPTIAGSFAVPSVKGLVLAAGLFAPNSPVADYPMTVNGQPAGSRYSLVSLDGSAIFNVGGWVAYAPIPELEIGAGFEMMTGTFKSKVVFSASPSDSLIGPSEAPQYDALSQLSVGPIFAPSGNAGVIVKPMKRVRLGLSGQLPFSVNAPAKVDVRLPSGPDAPEFANASQNGDSARFHFDFPGVIRLGVEVRPIDALRVEAAYVRELWSNHQTIDVTPQNIQMVGILGFPSPFNVAPISIPQHFRDTSSVRLGGEYGIPLDANRLDLRAGIAWEESAVPEPYLSVLALDVAKVTASVGAGFHLGAHWRFDAVYAHIFGFSTTVTPEEAAVPRINPVKGNATPMQAVNGGDYSAQADLIGLGAEYRF